MLVDELVRSHVFLTARRQSDDQDGSALRTTRRDFRLMKRRKAVDSIIATVLVVAVALAASLG